MTPKPIIHPRDRLIVALDLPDVADAAAMVRTLAHSCHFYKIGLQLLLQPTGVRFAESLIQQGKKLFVDAKLLDIDNSVMMALRSIERIGATYTTVHAYPNAMKAAVSVVSAGDDYAVKLLAVTVLTSMNDKDVLQAGYERSASGLVHLRARQAHEIGVHGLICSPQEIAMIRKTIGDGLILVTPGIRPSGSDLGDQRRIGTPGAAITEGADYIVVGRPIVQAADPYRAAMEIVEEIQGVAA